MRELIKMDLDDAPCALNMELPGETWGEEG